MTPQQSSNSERAAAFATMTSAAQTLASELETKLDQLNEGDLRIRHEIGLALKNAIEDNATYGSQVVKQLAEYLGESPDALYKLRNFASFFSCDQIRQWSARKLSSGGRLRYNHLTTIMVVESPAERLRLVELTFSESLSVRALRQLISDAQHEKRKTSKGGRKPKTILTGLQQLISRTKALQKGFPIWNETVFAAIECSDVSTVEKVVLHRVVEAANLLEEVNDQIQEARSHLRNGIAHLRSVPAARSHVTRRNRPAQSETRSDISRRDQTAA